jgi:hypothetical protein
MGLPVSLKQTACLLNCSSSDAGCGETESSRLLYWLPGTELGLAARHTSCRFSSEYLHPAILSFFFAQTPQTASSVSDSESFKAWSRDNKKIPNTHLDGCHRTSPCALDRYRKQRRSSGASCAAQARLAWWDLALLVQGRLRLRLWPRPRPRLREQPPWREPRSRLQRAVDWSSRARAHRRETWHYGMEINRRGGASEISVPCLGCLGCLDYCSYRDYRDYRDYIRFR